MSNDDLFEDNDVVLDSNEPLFDTESDKKEAGFSIDAELREWARDLAERLNNTENFSFSLYSTTYLSLMGVSKVLLPALYDTSATSIIAPYKASLSEDSIYTVQYLLELQRKIVIIGMGDTFAHQLLTKLDENLDGEPEDSFLTYCRQNLQKEVKNNAFYLDELLGCYSAFCNANNIAIDSNLIEHQMKTNVDSIERTLYGDMFLGNSVAGIGVIEDFVERRDDFMNTIMESAFVFVNKIQSAIDTVKSEREGSLA